MTTTSIKDKVETINFKGVDKPFLPAHEAITWFRTEYPGAQARINTRIEQVEGMSNNIVLAEIWIRADDGKMELVSTARKMGDGTSSLEMLETKAIRRALAFLGYGTVAAMAADEGADRGLSEGEQAQVAASLQGQSVDDMKKNLTGSGPRRIDTGKNNGAAYPRFDTGFDYAYFESVVTEVFKNIPHRNNALKKMFKENELAPDMDPDGAIAAVFAKYGEGKKGGDTA